jgi:hypothetical protein
MIRLTGVVLGLTTLFFCTCAASAGTIAGNVADYNAAAVRQTSGVLTVPANVATYTANSTVTIGSSFTIRLPSGFTFGSAPTLTTSGSSTFTLASGGLGSQTATFTVATADLTSGQTISLASFTVNGATALETVTPVASALAITMQVIGTDASPLSFKAFASATGAASIFVGAIQFIDENPPSNATKFLSSPDTLTAVISAAVVQTQTQDTIATSVPILGSNGLLNVISPSDTFTLVIGGNFGNIARVFSSTTSNCTSPINNGTVNGGSVSIPNVPVNQEVFFCITGSGGVLQSTPNGFTNVSARPGSSTDFLTTPAVVEFAGIICYTSGSGCDPNFVPPSQPVATPALSEWAIIGLAGMILLFGVWKLKARPTV